MAAIEKIKIGSTTYDLAASKLPKLGVNPLTNLVGASAADTVANWVTVGTGIGVIATADRGLMTGFPVSYSSWVLNLVFDSTSVYQIIYPYVQNGTIFHRAGNSNGWYETGWVKEFNSENIIPIANGGTGASTAAGALTNLGITATAAEINKLAGLKPSKAELDYVDGVTGNIQNQLNAKALAADVTMKVYKNIADIGMTAASTFADVVAAVPTNAVIYIAAGSLTDSSWSLPVTYGVIEIVRKGETQVAIKLHGRVGRVWIAETTTAGVPTGVWDELIRKSALDTALADKQDKITGAASSIISSDFTNTDAVLISNSSGKVSSLSGVTTTQLKTLQGINSNIQDQLDDKVSADGSIPMTDGLTINRATYPRVSFNETTVGSRGAIQNYGHAMVLDMFNVAGDDTNRRSLLLRDNSVDTLATAVRLRDKNSTEDKYYDIYGEHNIKASMTELGYVSGVKDYIQDQLDAKQATITGAASSIVSSDFSNTDVVLVSNGNGKVSSTSGVTKTELQTLQGVTRNLATTMTNLGTNVIDTSTNDTPTKWSELGSGYAYFSSTGRLVNQPAQYGIVVSNVVGAFVFQFFAVNSGTGSVYVRYGNSSGWRYNWSKLMDDRKFDFDSTTATLNITL